MVKSDVDHASWFLDTVSVIVQYFFHAHTCVFLRSRKAKEGGVVEGVGYLSR